MRDIATENHKVTETLTQRHEGASIVLDRPGTVPRFEDPDKTSPARPVRLGRLGLLALLVIGIGLVVGFLPRFRTHKILLQESKELQTPTVSVISATPGKSAAGASIPAEVKPFVEAPIYARASGYLKRYLVDIGDKVQPGQVLAEIETPELDQELARSKAELGQAQAALDLAKTTSARWADLLKTSSVSEQEAAEKQSDFALKTATVEAARANVRRLEELKSFAQVTAPFAGTITARRTDVGQLISANNGKELFRLSQTKTLRVFVRVPQNLARAVEPGQSADLVFAELPGKTFQAKVVRTAGAMDSDSRTLLTELAVDNSKGEMLAGSYAQVRFAEAKEDAPLTLPSNTLLFRSEGMQVGVVDADGKVELRSIKLGRDFGQRVEVVEGISASDKVILNPPDSLTAGLKVQVAAASSVK